MDERDRVRAFFGGDRVDVLAQPAQLLHADDCVFHLVWLDVLEFVDVEALFVVSFGEENDRDAKGFAPVGSRRKPGRESIEQYPTRV